MESHFSKLLDRSDGRDRFDAVRAAIVEFENHRGFNAGRIELSSGLPGGAAMHKAVAKVVSRQVNGLVEQLNGFSGSLAVVLDRLAAVDEGPPAHSHSDLLHELDTVQDRLGAVERLVRRLDASARDLDGVVSRLETHLTAFGEMQARLAALEEAEKAHNPTPESQ